MVTEWDGDMTYSHLLSVHKPAVEEKAGRLDMKVKYSCQVRCRQCRDD